MEQYALKSIFLSMMYVARNEKVTVDRKYNELENWINANETIELMGMIDNIETVYQLIEKDKEIEWLDFKTVEDFRTWISNYGTTEDLAVEVDDDQLVVINEEREEELFRINIGRNEGLFSKYLLLHICEEEGVTITSD